MQFHITAMDGTDNEAPKRRECAWLPHLDYVTKQKVAGTFLLGGTIVDEAGNKIGSTLFVEVDDRSALDCWLADDPFSQQNVWQSFDIKIVEIPPFE